MPLAICDDQKKPRRSRRTQRQNGFALRSQRSPRFFRTSSRRSSRRDVVPGAEGDVAIALRVDPARTPAVGPARLTVGLLTGCVQRLVFPRVNAATVNVLVSRRLRRARAGRAGLLRRARAACRARRRGARVRAPHDRGLRARGRRTDRRQRGRLRIVDEGVRRSCSPTIPPGPIVRGHSRRACAT